MEVYLYTARDLLTQKKVKGELPGESVESVRKILIHKNLNPKSIKRKNMFNTDITLFRGRVKLIDISFFCKQFTAMIQAGISITKGLELCGKQATNKVLAGHIEHIYKVVSEGKPLSQAADEEKIFPDILVNLIACGEASGNLEEVMKRAVKHIDNQLVVRKKVKKALTYPIIVLGIIAIVITILMIKVVPAYTELLNDIGVKIPLPTQIIIIISNFFVNQWRMLLSILIALIVVVLNIKKVSSIKRALDHLILKLPLFGEMTKKNLTATFSSTMSMLIQSGIPMLQAMEITKKVMGNAIAEEEIKYAIQVLKQGNSLLEAISVSSIFPSLLLNMISIGEESGTLDEMLDKVSIFFKEEVEIAVDNLTILIEPILIVIVAVIIGGIMASIMLPTFSAAATIM